MSHMARSFSCSQNAKITSRRRDWVYNELDRYSPADYYHAGWFITDPLKIFFWLPPPHVSNGPPPCCRNSCEPSSLACRLRATSQAPRQNMPKFLVNWVFSQNFDLPKAPRAIKYAILQAPSHLQIWLAGSGGDSPTGPRNLLHIHIQVLLT